MGATLPNAERESDSLVTLLIFSGGAKGARRRGLLRLTAVSLEPHGSTV